MGSDIWIYLIKIVAIQGVFFLLYYCFLRDKTTYGVNRIYLLTSLVCSFLIPLIEIPVETEVMPEIVEIPFSVIENNIQNTTQFEVITKSAKETHEPFNYWLILTLLYGLLTVILFVRSIVHLINLQKLKTKSEYVERQWFNLFKTTQIHPFSFLSNVFIPKEIFGSGSFNQILEHECEHVRQHHSIDRLLIDFMVALFWFNPFIYLYRRALIEIHEYQADSAVLRKYPDPIRYQEILFSQLHSNGYSGLVSHFNFSTIKKRIVMINKQKKSGSFWAYALAIPVTLTVILAFANRIPIEPPMEPQPPIVEVEVLPEPELKPEPQEFIEAKVPIEEPSMVPMVEPVGEPDQETNIPSILPIKRTGKIEITSGYGMRRDPIDGEKKMHKGIDFRAEIGTPVYATADGEIHEASVHKGYGNYVMIAHGEKYMTRYAQLSSYTVKRGDKVKKGQEIGLSGNSGRSTAPHLHYEVIEVGVGYRNPQNFIKDYQFEVTPEPETIEVTPSPSENKSDDKNQELASELERLTAEKNRLELELYESELLALAKINRREWAKMEAEEMQEQAEMTRAQIEVRIEEKELQEAMEGLKLLKLGMRLNKSKQPLYILDGERIEMDDEQALNPDEILEVQVVKGDKAIEQYGEEGENGVIVITSKKNKKKSKDKKKAKSEKG